MEGKSISQNLSCIVIVFTLSVNKYESRALFTSQSPLSSVFRINFSESFKIHSHVSHYVHKQ